MRSTLPQRVTTAPRKITAEAFALSAGDRKKLAGEDIGRIVLRVIALSRLTQQLFSDRLGYPDQSAVSRWVAGVENAQAFGRIWSVEDFRPFLLVALAEEAKSSAVGGKFVIEVSA